MAMGVLPARGGRRPQDLSGVQSQNGQMGIVGRGGNFQQLGQAAQGRVNQATTDEAGAQQQASPPQAAPGAPGLQSPSVTASGQVSGPMAPPVGQPQRPNGQFPLRPPTAPGAPSIVPHPAQGAVPMAPAGPVQGGANVAGQMANPAVRAQQIAQRHAQLMQTAQQQPPMQHSGLKPAQPGAPQAAPQIAPDAGYNADFGQAQAAAHSGLKPAQGGIAPDAGYNVQFPAGTATGPRRTPFRPQGGLR
jgi:hypothetical protein